MGQKMSRVEELKKKLNQKWKHFLAPSVPQRTMNQRHESIETLTHWPNAQASIETTGEQSAIVTSQ